MTKINCMNMVRVVLYFYRHAVFDIRDKCFGKYLTQLLNILQCTCFVIVTFEPDPITLPHVSTILFYTPNNTGMYIYNYICVFMSCGTLEPLSDSPPVGY